MNTAISVSLPGNIVYVAGYVNDVATVFQQDSYNAAIWRAIVAVAENNMYHIVLELHDSSGNVTNYDEVIEFALPEFVYDRKQADVDRVKELRNIGWQNMTDEQRAEWLGGLKGCLNTSDLKRIENNIYVIAQLLGLNLSTCKDNLPEIPNASYFTKMLENVAKIRAVGYLHKNTPVAPVQPLNTYQKVNVVERILHDVYEVYLANCNNVVYSGEIYAGENIGTI